MSAMRKATLRAVGEDPSRPRTPRHIISKAPHDYRTDMDVAIEREISSVIHDEYPFHRIVGEELTHRGGDGKHTWYIDPIDGTRNLVAGRPEIAISLALFEDNHPVLGVVGLPCRSLVLAAESGRQGIFINGKHSRPPTRSAELRDTLVGIQGDFQKFKRRRILPSLVASLVEEVDGIRVTGALTYDLATLALGELGARISFAAKTVDVAAGVLLITNNGGVVTDIRGNPWSTESDSILASSSQQIHSSLLQILLRDGLV